MDDTLREGEQTSEVRYTPGSRVKIFENLVDVGLRLVNIGSPIVPHNFSGIKKIMKLGYGDVEAVGHCACRKLEVDKAIGCGLESIKLYIAPTKEHLMAKFGKKFKTLEEARAFCIEATEKSVSYARSRGIKKISYTAEDMTSTLYVEDERDFAYKAIRTALDGGARRVSLPDTRGRVVPEEVGQMIYDFRRNFSNYDLEIEGHFHNDLGLALANSMEAIKSGASIIHTTINAMGERVGITALEQLDAALYYGWGYDTGLKHRNLYGLSSFLESASGFPVARNSPVVGKNAAVHTGGNHQRAVVKNPMTYQVLEPEIFGREPVLAFGALMGKEGLKGLMKTCGVREEKIKDPQLSRILDKIRRYHVKTGLNDIFVAKEIMEKELKQPIRLPSSYLENIYQEARLQVATKAGTDENLIKSKLMGLIKLKDVIRAEELFGSPHTDYQIFLRYGMKDARAPHRMKSRIGRIKGILETHVVTVGDAVIK